MEVVLKAIIGHATGCIRCVVWAYIDPSTGSLVFQVMAASLISASLFIRGLRERIAWLITGGWRRQPHEDRELEIFGADDVKSASPRSNEPARKAA